MRSARHGTAAILPWGWWLREFDGHLVDEQGARWGSVRDAFWQGHLKFPENHHAQEQHELMLRVLTNIDAMWRNVTEQKEDIFDDHMMFWRFYFCWLGSVGMLELTTSGGVTLSVFEAPLSDEGRSVMLMLQATREPGWEHLPMRDVVEAATRHDLGADDDIREEALHAFEQAVGRRRWTFERGSLHRSHLVTLTGLMAHARMPTLSVIWSQSFADRRTRDEFFAWIAGRVDRWDDWGEIAYRRGADALTSHLLRLNVGSNGFVR